MSVCVYYSPVSLITRLFELQLFFRAGTLAKLEEQRDEQTRKNLTMFQASCRGYVARQAFKKMKVSTRGREIDSHPEEHKDKHVFSTKTSIILRNFEVTHSVDMVQTKPKCITNHGGHRGKHQYSWFWLVSVQAHLDLFPSSLCFELVLLLVK